MPNNALSFNGSTQYGQIDNFSGIDGLTDYTLEGWVKNTATSHAYAGIFVIEDTVNNFSRFKTENGTGNEGFNFSTSFSSTSADGYESSTRLVRSTWVHVAVVYNHTLKKTSIFINGIENNDYNLQQTGSGSIQDPTGMFLRLGVSNTEWEFDGAIGGFLRLWNRALNGAEIYLNYNKKLTPANESGLIVNCNFEEESGSVVDNDATPGEDLDLYNSPTWVAGPTITSKSYSNFLHLNQVRQSTDDSEENFSGTGQDVASSDLEFSYDGANPGYIGIRFSSVSIPKGATIQSAYLLLVGDESQSTGTVDVTIKGHKVSNSSTFTTSAGDISGRYSGSPTTASVAWNSVPATVPGNIYQSPEIKTIIQEIIDQAGWNSGQALSLLVRGAQTTRRTFESYDGQFMSAPMLHVEYTTASSYVPKVMTFF